MLYMVTGMGDKTTAVHASVFKSVVVFDFVLLRRLQNTETCIVCLRLVSRYRNVILRA